MTLTINNKSEINAKGKLTGKRCKPVICIDTGEVYSSATDAAEMNDSNIWSVSCVCLGKTKKANGKRFCYLENVSEHLDELTERVREMHSAYANLEAKAEAYDKMMVQKHLIAKMESDLEATRQEITALKEKEKMLEEQITVLKREEI